MKGPLYIHDFAVCCILGEDKASVWDALVNGVRPRFAVRDFCGKERLVAEIPESSLPHVNSPYDNHVNRLSEKVLRKMEVPVSEAVKRWGANRIGVFVGTSDNGAEASLFALGEFRKDGKFPQCYSLKMQQADFAAEFVAQRFRLEGPVVALSSACASSASAFASARDWMEAGFCDAAIVGGVDVATETVVLGFDSLEAVSLKPTIPFSRNRSGLNIGDGAAFFLVSKEPLSAQWMVSGIGESSDASHATAPRPDGFGAILSMERALHDAGIQAADVDYVNLHGTGTRLNDAMESVAVHDVFGDSVFCSSTKGLTGHTLGASGALEAAFCALALSSANVERKLPVHCFDGERDTSMPQIRLVAAGDRKESLRRCMSNSFGFGGCNVSLVIEKVGR